MQITVDTEKDSAAVLSNVGKFLVLGYGSLADKIATVASALPQPGAAVVAAVEQNGPGVRADAPSFLPSDNLPPDALEAGKPATDVRAASVFAGSAVPAPPPAPPAPPAPLLIPRAPPAIPPAPGAVAGPVERDTAGIPYNARIHNKSRTKKQDGTWKLAKGIDPVVVAAVLQELTGSTATTVVPAAPLAPAAPPVPPAPIAPVAPAAVIPPAAPSIAPGAAVSFRDVMKKVTEGQTAGRFNKAQIDWALGQVGFKPDELAPLVMPANAALLSAFNNLIDSVLVPPA